MEMALIFWLLCGVFSAVLAVSRGRSAAWFLVGLLFGPFGLLVAAMPRVDKTAGRQPVTSDADPKRLKSAYERQQDALREAAETSDPSRIRDAEEAMVDALASKPTV